MLELEPMRNKIRMLEVRLKSKDEEWREHSVDIQNRMNYFKSKYKTVLDENSMLRADNNVLKADLVDQLSGKDSNYVKNLQF